MTTNDTNRFLEIILNINTDITINENNFKNFILAVTALALQESPIHIWHPIA